MGQVDHPAFLLIDGHLKQGQFLTEAFVDRLQQPSMVSVGIDHNHEIISKAHVCEIRVLAAAGDLFRSLQHPIHFREIQITEQCAYSARRLVHGCFW